MANEQVMNTINRSLEDLKKEIATRIVRLDKSKNMKKIEHIENALKSIEKKSNIETLLGQISNEEINKLTWYGVEGEHYTADGDEYYTPTEKSSNFPAGEVCPWGWYSSKYAMTSTTEPAIVQETIDKWKENDTVDNPLTAFTFDDSEVKNEMSAVGNVVTQYGVPIDLGMVDDVEAAVKEYRTKLSEAGLDKIIEKCKEQVADFLESYNE